MVQIFIKLCNWWPTNRDRMISVENQILFNLCTRPRNVCSADLPRSIKLNWLTNQSGNPPPSSTSLRPHTHTHSPTHTCIEPLSAPCFPPLEMVLINSRLIPGKTGRCDRFFSLLKMLDSTGTSQEVVNSAEDECSCQNEDNLKKILIKQPEVPPIICRPNKHMISFVG